MIIITEIKTIETPGDWFEYAEANIPATRYRDPGDLMENREFYTRQLIKGRIFVKPNGEEIAIGMTCQASEVLEIVYDTYHTIDQARKEQNELKLVYRYRLQRALEWIEIPIFKKLYWLLFDCVKYHSMKSALISYKLSMQETP